MWVSVDHIWRESDSLEYVAEEFFDFWFRDIFAVCFEGFGDDIACCHSGVEAGEGVLEDDLELASFVAELLMVDEVFAHPEDISAAGGEELEDCASEGRFSAAGFADDSESFTGVEVEADIVDGFEG